MPPNERRAISAYFKRWHIYAHEIARDPQITNAWKYAFKSRLWNWNSSVIQWFSSTVVPFLNECPADTLKSKKKKTHTCQKNTRSTKKQAILTQRRTKNADPCCCQRRYKSVTGLGPLTVEIRLCFVFCAARASDAAALSRCREHALCWTENEFGEKCLRGISMHHGEHQTLSQEAEKQAQGFPLLH